jgi:hypothetical protein
LNKVIFLDIDGVLNNKDTFPNMCYEKVQLLKHIIEKTAAKIVISSSWRHGGINEGSAIHEQLMKNDPEGIVFNAIIDITPRPGYIDPPLQKDYVRGHEIARWIEDNAFDGKFVILDDDRDMAHLEPYLIKTDTDIGMLCSHAKKVIDLLSN